ncbi:MAG TPA: hypothetical protein VG871_14570 [Vicinamibacterales bacterium]|nr:hypothetical protein [Vicinamibacterales bacterium]
MAQFPHLRGEIGGSYPVPEEAVKRRGGRRRRGRMSPAARKAASLRMKKYWAAKRAAGK